MNTQRIHISHPEGGVISAVHVSAAQQSAAGAPSTGAHLSGDLRPLLVFSHATGFHAETYRPLFRHLAPHMDILAADSRGHGQSGLPAVASELRGWARYYDDLAHLVTLQNRPVFLAGHSIGGLCSLAVAARLPQRVLGVVAMDPVLLDPRQGIPMRMLQWMGRSDRFSLAAGAKRRRAEFASAEEAFASYRSKRSFETWPDEWLKAYTDGAFRENGTGVRLRCEPEWECRTFSMVEAWPWRFLPRIEAPVEMLVAARGSTCSKRSRQRLAAMHPAWSIRELPYTTHFLPMEKTADIASIITGFVLQTCERIDTAAMIG